LIYVRSSVFGRGEQVRTTDLRYASPMLPPLIVWRPGGTLDLKSPRAKPPGHEAVAIMGIASPPCNGEHRPQPPAEQPTELTHRGPACPEDLW